MDAFYYFIFRCKRFFQDLDLVMLSATYYLVQAHLMLFNFKVIGSNHLNETFFNFLKIVITILVTITHKMA